MDLPLLVVVVAGLAALAGAAVQGSVGLGLGLLAAPVFALLEPSLVPATILLVTSVLPLLTSLRELELEDVDWSGLGFALLGGDVSSVLALTLAGQVEGRDLLRAAALLPFVLTGFLLSGPLRRRVDGADLRRAVLLLSSGGALLLLGRTLVG